VNAEFKWNPIKCEAIFQTFRDYWKAQPGLKGVKADWEATWRNWCRRETTTFQKHASLGREIRVRETTPKSKGRGSTQKLCG
jgi:hypothetical protein